MYIYYKLNINNRYLASGENRALSPSYTLTAEGESCFELLMRLFFHCCVFYSINMNSQYVSAVECFGHIGLEYFFPVGWLLFREKKLSQIKTTGTITGATANPRLRAL